MDSTVYLFRDTADSADVAKTKAVAQHSVVENATGRAKKCKITDMTKKAT